MGFMQLPLRLAAGSGIACRVGIAKQTVVKTGMTVIGTDIRRNKTAAARLPALPGILLKG
jgi:hypothetical protein